MANNQPTKISIIKKIKLFYKFFLDIQDFKRMESEDNLRLNKLKNRSSLSRDDVLRFALLRSLKIIFFAGFFGILLGFILNKYWSNPSSYIIAFLQTCSALILLWATLALRGWDIQSFGGVTLTERINTFIFQSLYFIGTVLFVITMLWGL